MAGQGPQVPADTTKLLALMMAMVASLMVYEWAVQNDLGSPLLADTSPFMRLLCYAVLLLIAGAGFALDWNELGPTVAMKRGLLASLVAWMLIVPLGVISELFIHSVWFFGILCAGAAGAIYLLKNVGGPVSMVGAGCIMVLCWFLATHESQLRELEHVIGIAGIFLAVSVLVRLSLHAAADKLEPVEVWPGSTRVEQDSDEFREKKAFFEARAVAFADKYPFWLQMVALYRIDPAVGNPKGGPVRHTNNGMELFHGTRRECALGIIQDGFRLPSHPGMFGKGIYFADCPLKSWQYTDGVKNIRNGLIMLCWVELGRQSHQKQARNELTRPPRRTFMQWLRSEERYTSVVGDDKDAGGALRVPEYIVYDTNKIAIQYICEVACVPPGTPDPETVPVATAPVAT
mmetsp:Transcript_102369/g.318901  ORF Transcript_102369/g.318901 Transcript_102369/m.318901 type:complete len:403 (-) Transcript_102369:38-1246(-)